MSRVRERSSDLLLIDLGREMMTISTAGCPRIYENIRYLVFKRVPRDFSRTDLDRYCREISREIGLEPEEATIFLTAVDLSTYAYERVEERDLVVEIYATIGIEHPICLMSQQDPRGEIGTINIAVITSKSLGRAGLADLFRLVSEIKGVLLALGGLDCVNSPFIGTASDATAVAAPAGEDRFAGAATELGGVVIKTLTKLLRRELKRIYSSDFAVRSLGVENFDELIRLTMKIYRFAAVPGLEESVIERDLREEYERVLSDPNTILLIRGVRLLEQVLGVDLIPGIDREEYARDAAGLVVDELLGKALAEYVNGFRGLLAYYWIERLKERDLEEIREKPPLTDDLLSSLIGGVLSRIYDKYSRR